MRQQLRDLIRAGREKEAADLVPHVSAVQAGRSDRWTAKDQLAHLSAWREIAVAEVAEVCTGAPAAAVADTDDIENARIYEETHSQPATVIREAARSSWDQLAAAMETCSEEDLTKPRIRRPAQQLWQLIPNNAYFHVAEHLGYWYVDEGNEAAAEGAAKWGHDLMISTFQDDRNRGVAAYNLGCFYAKRGRTEQAVPYLRQGFQLRPELRDWAKQDTDLDPIRSTREFAGLLS